MTMVNSGLKGLKEEKLKKKIILYLVHCICFDSICRPTYSSNFHPLEVVGRGSE